MKKILLSLGTLVFAGGLLAGGTGAYMTGIQTSTGNTFASGIIDLTVDNESYVTNGVGTLVFSTSTSWLPSSLAGKYFFNFQDVKPGDIGEDTISLHIGTNDAWSCMKVSLTGTPENGRLDPEIKAGDTSGGSNQGELQNVLQFAFWADDGDNVYEKGEKIYKEGRVKDIFLGTWWTLADAGENIWKSKIPGYSGDSSGNWSGKNDDYDDGHHQGNSNGDPLRGKSTVYIGKVWCFGKLAAAPVKPDGLGKTGTGIGGSTNGPLQRHATGFTCNGQPVGNVYQSDGIKVDVSFIAIQSRDNSSFKCAKSASSGSNDGHDD